MTDREKLIDLLCNIPVAEEIADFFIANGVTIPVKCKDCKWWSEDVPLCRHEKSARWYMNGNDFCSYGERKDNG